MLAQLKSTLVADVTFIGLCLQGFGGCLQILHLPPGLHGLGQDNRNTSSVHL